MIQIYVGVPLGKSLANSLTENAMRISSQEETILSKVNERTNSAMPTFNSSNHANGATLANGDDPANDEAHYSVTEHAGTSLTGSSFDAWIAEAQALRDSLHDGYARAGQLCVSLKRHRKQSKIVASTLATLRQLQQIEG